MIRGKGYIYGKIDYSYQGEKINRTFRIIDNRKRGFFFPGYSRGSACYQKSVVDLIEILWFLEVKIPQLNNIPITNSVEDMRDYLIDYNMKDFNDIEELIYYFKILSSKSLTKLDLCQLLENELVRIDHIIN